jgi:hypothetical protein
MYLKTASGMQQPMKCGWSARAETAMGALIMLSGGLLIVRGTPETRQTVGILQWHSGSGHRIPDCFNRDVYAGRSPCRINPPCFEILGVIITRQGFLLCDRKSLSFPLFLEDTSFTIYHHQERLFSQEERIADLNFRDFPSNEQASQVWQ